MTTLWTMWTMVLGVSGLLGWAGLLGGEAPGETDKPEGYVLNHEMQRITGESESLETYEGKVVLMVNVASKCGYTPQYEGLEALYREFKDEGLVILGFPANDFGGQEPGSNEDILEFCQARFDVTFPMFAKIAVTGESVHPLYEKLAAQPEPIGGEPRWNFTKFLVDRDGRVVNRYEPGVTPSDDALRARIEALLATR